MRTLAVLPVKSFPNAKRRLGSGIDPELRSRLVESMLHDVLDALSATRVEGVIVVTAGEAGEAIAREYGAAVVADREEGHNQAALLGVEAALERGAERVLLVPGDCPALDPADVDALLDRPIGSPSVVIVPDRHGTGTNALLITPPGALRPSFGPESRERHVTLARAAGVAQEVVVIPSLALDVDTPEDLAALGQLTDAGRRTHHLLLRC